MTGIHERTGSLLLLHLRTIFAVMMLNFCVRYGYRCFHHAIATGSSELYTQNRIISLFSHSTLVKSSLY